MQSAQRDTRATYGRAFEAPPEGVSFAHPPLRLERILRQLDEEVVDHFSGCGSPIPESIEGRRILDLGCGTGRDVFLCASLAGPAGFVLGLDNEEEGLTIARRHVEATMARLGHPEPTVAFRRGSIDRLRDAELNEEDFDVVISNRALNLVKDKLAVLREVFRVLKPGGELYFADVYSDRRLPPDIVADEEINREHLGGALYVGDFLRLARRAGFLDPRIVETRPLALADPELGQRLGGVVFWTATFRLFKISGLEDGEEDYGQAAIYRGTVEGCAHHFQLDTTNRFETGRAQRIGGNTARILTQSRFAPHFKLTGNQNLHFGPFVP
jgi:SAM-dependent methyltransferase